MNEPASSIFSSVAFPIISKMLAFRYALPFISESQTPSTSTSRPRFSLVVCAAKPPRPRVWKTQKKFGAISKSAKLVDCVKGLSNVKEEVYGALDSFIAWDLEFPLIVVKKALKTLENEREWKRIIQMAKWMLSKGQGKTLGTYLTLINALVEDGRVDEAEEIWEKVFAENLESTPRYFFEKMVGLYYNRGMHDKLFEIFADMDELGITPTVPVVKMVGSVFRDLGMMDKYQKLMRKYPPPKWEFRFIGGKRVKVRAKQTEEFNQVSLPEKSSSVDLDESSSGNEGVNEAMDSSKLCMEAGEDELVSKNSRGMYEDAEH